MSRLLLLGFVLVGCGVTEVSVQGVAAGSQLPAVDPLCTATDAKLAFGTNAVCVCDDFHLLGAGFVTRPAGDIPANVGVNGKSWIIGLHELGGSLVAMQGMAGVGDITTHGNISTASDVLGVGLVTVKGDMMIGGKVSGVALIDVDGTLGVRDDSKLLGTQRFGKRGPYVEPTEPCGCAAPAIDVTAKVAEAKASAKQLDSSTKLGSTGLTLGAGRYYADSLANLGVLELTIDGAVSLALGGSLDAIGIQRINVKQGATLDLYVAGGLATIGWSLVGEGATPGAVRIYLGGERRVTLAAGLQALNASIYAPKSTVALAGDTDLTGAVFAKGIVGLGRLAVDYAPAVVPEASKCLIPQ